MKEIDLNKTKLKSGFKVPENYFSEFENSFLSQISENEPKRNVFTLITKDYHWMKGIAATVLLFISVYAFTQLFNKQNEDSISLESYLSTEISSYELAENLTEETFVNLEAELAFNDDAIESYLNDVPNIDYYLNE